MLLDNHGSFSRNKKNIYIICVSGVMFDMKDSLTGLDESASHPTPSTRGSAPSNATGGEPTLGVKTIYGKAGLQT